MSDTQRRRDFQSTPLALVGGLVLFLSPGGSQISHSCKMNITFLHIASRFLSLIHILMNKTLELSVAQMLAR